MSAVLKEQMSIFPETQEEFWNAVAAKDSSFDGHFVFAVSSTGIYCRPSCPSRRARRENVSFFQLPEAAEQAGFRACRRCHPKRAAVANPQIKLTQEICKLIETNQGEPLTLARLSEETRVSSFHLQRTFKGVMGITPAQYAEACRLRNFKQSVREGEAITNAIYDAGYGSSSRLYEDATSKLGMTPATYGKGGRGATINYAIGDSPLGKLLVAATSKGVCSVKLGDTAAELKADLVSEFPAAEIHHDEESLAVWLQAVVDSLGTNHSAIDLPLDIRATAFQKRVWEQLRAIPRGETYSYSQLAGAIGEPKAVRAVARACATNPVALVIPCHRVIREDKSLGGYRWGLERKKKLLEEETRK